MTTVVFIGGSRAVSRLNKQIAQRLDSLMMQGHSVVIGDAAGADKAVQSYFAKNNYRSVTIHCMHSCRNNVGSWPVRYHFSTAGARRDRNFYAIKDRAMAKEASCGFMLWDGKSKGTLANVAALLAEHKKVLLYHSSTKQFHTVTTYENLIQSMENMGIDAISEVIQALGIAAARQPSLAFTS